MNSKSPSTSCDSLNSILTKANNENLYRQIKDTSHDFINLENIDVNLVDYLNNEFINSGYQSLQKLGSSRKNYNILFENAIDLISRYNRQLAAFNRAQEANLKLDHENEMLLKRQQALKDSSELANRELASYEEKCRQAQTKASNLNKTVKDLTDENRKLQNTIEQRDKQFKHERKKFEKENNKLKERVQMLTTGKTKELPNIDLTETVYRGSNGTRATWNTDGSKKQIELYSELIKDYDRKNKELILENNDIKSFLADIYTNLSKSLTDSLGQHSPERSVTNMNISNLDEDLNSTDRCIAEEIVHHPFDNIHSKLMKEFKKKFDQIKELQSESGFGFHGNNNINQNNNITISSINSMSSKTTNVLNDEDILNATFTIDNDKIHEDNKHRLDSKVNSFLLEKTISSSTSSSSASPPSMSILSEHLEKIQNPSKSSKFVRNKIGFNFTETSNEFIDEFSKIKCGQVSDHEGNILNFNEDLNFKNDLSALAKERKKLAMEKKLFYEQKMKLEDEASSFQHLSADFIKQKNEFQDEQEKYYQTQFYSSFVNKPKSHNY